MPCNKNIPVYIEFVKTWYLPVFFLLLIYTKYDKKLYILKENHKKCKKSPNWRINLNFLPWHVSVHLLYTSMSWIRIRISPYESGSDINRTNLDPRIRIHITGSSLCPLYQFFFCFDKLYSILSVIFLAKFLKFTDLYCTRYFLCKI